MDFLQASVEHGKYHNQVKRFSKTTQALGVQKSRPRNPQIKKCIKRLTKRKLFGHPHVKQYLYDQYRRGCRPNTIRSNFESIILFIKVFKKNGLPKRRNLSGTSMNLVRTKLVIGVE